MKNYLMISVLLMMVSSVSEAQEVNKIKLEKINDAISHYCFTLWAMNEKPPHRVKKAGPRPEYRDNTFMGMFLSPENCLVEDMFVSPTVSHREPKSPIDIFLLKLSTEGAGQFSKVTLNYRWAKFRCETPVPLDVQMLKSDPPLKYYLSDPVLGILSRSGNNYEYVKTYIITQKFKGNEKGIESADVDIENIVAVHWVFPRKDPTKLTFNDFKIIAWHTTSDKCQDCHKLKGLDKKYYKNEDKDDLKSGEMEMMRDSGMFLGNEWCKAFTTQPGNAFQANQQLFASGATAVNPYDKNIMPHPVTQTVPDMKPSEALHFEPLEIQKKPTSIGKNRYAFWVYTSLSDQFESDSGTVCSFKKPVPLRIQVQFDREKRSQQLINFKIYKVDFEDKYNHSANFSCTETDAPETLTPVEEGFEPDFYESDEELISNAILKQTAEMLDMVKMVASGKKVDMLSFYKMFKKGRKNTIEVIGCETRITQSVNISNYPTHIRALPYSEIQFHWYDLQLKKAGNIKENSSEFQGTVSFSQIFRGFDANNKVAYADRTVKKIEVTAAKTQDGIVVQFGNILVVENHKIDSKAQP